MTTTQPFDNFNPSVNMGAILTAASVKNQISDDFRKLSELLDRQSFDELPSAEKNRIIRESNARKAAAHKSTNSNTFAPTVIGTYPNGTKLVLCGNHYEIM